MVTYIIDPAKYLERFKDLFGGDKMELLEFERSSIVLNFGDDECQKTSFDNLSVFNDWILYPKSNRLLWYC